MIPATLTQGDVFELVIPGGTRLPADNWSARLGFVSPDHDAVSLSSTADGTNHKIRSDRLALDPGDWSWQIAMIDGTGGQHSIGAGRVTVSPNLFVADNSDFDGSTKNEVILTAITETLQGTAKQALQQITVDGVQIGRRTDTELAALKSRFERLVREERAASRRASQRTPSTTLEFIR